MLSCQLIMNALERIAPRRLAEDWDNPGLLVGSYAQKVGRVLVALDVDDCVTEEAIARGADMIVAHHPAIFRGMKQLRTDLPLGGVNDVLAAHLGLEKLSSFVISSQEEGVTESLGRMGVLPAPLAIEDFARTVKERLGVSHVRLAAAAARPVRRVAVCGGAGAEFIDNAVRLGADVYVTGDVKYHDAQRAVEQGMHIIDAGHFGTEAPVLPVLAEHLRAELASEHGEIEIFVTDTQRDVFDVII